MDLTRAYEKNVPNDAWQRYLDGDKTVFARRIVQRKDQYSLDTIKRQYAENTEFRDNVSRYFAQFEKLLEEAEQHDPEDLISAAFLSSDIGKLYLLLSRALDRIR